MLEDMIRHSEAVSIIRKCVSQNELGRATVTNSPPDLDDVKWGRQTAFRMSRIVSILGFMGHVVSAATLQQLLRHKSSFRQNRNERAVFQQNFIYVNRR